MFEVVILNLLFFLTFFAFIFFRNKYNKLKIDVLNIEKNVNRVRYGDINVRVSNLNNKKLETVINRFIETIYDREMMIREYQATLSKKNLSLKEVIEQEKQLQKFKEEFTATLTHDMKVPVIAELNSINYLLEGRFGKLNEKQTEVLNLMKTSNQELKDLIENILEVYKLEQKSLIINKSENNINEFIKSVVNEMLPICAKTNHKIVCNLETTSETRCLFDNFQLKRVLKNIIQNALNYSPNNSEINITTKITSNKLEILITNKGCSISKEDLELIFQKYYSGHSKFKKAGTGLGLYISEQIMLAHNGKIDVNSSDDGYTTFILTLPG